MKKIYLFLFITFLTVGILASVKQAETQSENNRPTRHYLIRFDNNQSVQFEADSTENALEIFRKTVSKDAIVYSVNRQSFVSTEWIRCEPC